jgi:hypothetical protein
MNASMESSGSFRFDKLLAGDFPRATKDVTVQANLNLKRGTVLGKVTAVIASTGTAGGGNTGNGTVANVAAENDAKAGTYSLVCITAETNGGIFQVTDPDGNVLGNARTGKYAGTGNGTISNVRLGVEGKDGLYSVKCITAVAHGGVFEVRDPDGNLLGTATIPAGAGNSVDFNHPQIRFTITDGTTDFIVNDEFSIAPYRNDQISLVITDGATDFIVGDTFTIACTVGSREVVAVDSSLANGAQNPYAVLAEDVDTVTTGAACNAASYESGKFNRDYLFFGGSDTIATHETAMRSIGLLVAETIPVPGETAV